MPELHQTISAYATRSRARFGVLAQRPVCGGLVFVFGHVIPQFTESDHHSVFSKCHYTKIALRDNGRVVLFSAIGVDCRSEKSIILVPHKRLCASL